jgi:hypothetical protein
MLVSLALCGAATTVMVVSSANAQPEAHNPVMVPPPPGLDVAQNDVSPPDGPPPRDLRRNSGDFAAHMKQMCQDAYAHQAGDLTYLQNRLALTASQQSAFQRWQQAKLGIAKRHQDDCAARPVNERSRAKGQNQNERPGPGAMMSREEDKLKQRLADIEAERPALEALYTALSPQQRIQLIRAGRTDRMGPRHMFADARGQRGRMGPPPGAPPYGPDSPPPTR